MAEFVRVAAIDEIPSGRAKMVQARGTEIALFNLGGVFYAIDNMCSHVGGPLCEGTIDGNEVTCPWHGAVFDITTGNVLGPPASMPLTRYNLRMNGPDLEIEI